MYCVPVFLMLSGMLMLNKERSIRTVLLHSSTKVLGYTIGMLSCHPPII